MRKACNKNTNKYRQLHFHNHSSQVVYKPILSASASSSAILKPEKALGTRVPSKIASSSFLFLSRISDFLSRISHFYLAFNSRFFFSSFIKSHLECPLQASVQSCHCRQQKRRRAQKNKFFISKRKLSENAVDVGLLQFA